MTDRPEDSRHPERDEEALPTGDAPTTPDADTPAQAVDLEDTGADEAVGDKDIARQPEPESLSQPQPQPLFEPSEAPVISGVKSPKEHALARLRERARVEQGEMPFAVIQGKAMTQIPMDLYIPPDALEVFLDAFEGPLDLLLYLIKKQNLDILNINVFEITEQYMQYVDLMHAMQLELAAEYLVMAAMLAEIKSRMLLPRSKNEEEEEDEDPRAELIRRLQEYEQFKTAAENLDELPRVGRDIYTTSEHQPDYKRPKMHPDVEMREVLLALKEVLARADMFEHHEIQRETLSTRQRMGEVLERLNGSAFVPFITLFDAREGRLGVVVTFLAIMELTKESLIDLIQNEAFAPIHVKARSE